MFFQAAKPKLLKLSACKEEVAAAAAAVSLHSLHNLLIVNRNREKGKIKI